MSNADTEENRNEVPDFFKEFLLGIAEQQKREALSIMTGSGIAFTLSLIVVIGVILGFYYGIVSRLWFKAIMIVQMLNELLTLISSSKIFRRAYTGYLSASNINEELIDNSDIFATGFNGMPININEMLGTSHDDKDKMSSMIS